MDDIFDGHQLKTVEVENAFVMRQTISLKQESVRGGVVVAKGNYAYM